MSRVFLNKQLLV